MSHFMLIESIIQIQITKSDTRKNRYLHSSACVKEIEFVIPQRELQDFLINFTKS